MKDDHIFLWLPVPPSANNLFANRRRGGRYKTKRYLEWIKKAGAEVLLARPRPIQGSYALSLTLPKIRGDADNRIKAVNDLLVDMCLVGDDSQCKSIRVEVDDEGPRGLVMVAVERME